MKIVTFIIIVAGGLATLTKARDVCCPAARVVWTQTHDGFETQKFYDKCVQLRGIEDKIRWPQACIENYKK